jgi:HTH-type transcriptional regulator / antitoxin HigA
MEMSANAVPKGYSALLKTKVPRAIRSRRDYESYLAEVSDLLAADRSAAESEYLALLAVLIKTYESEQIRLPKATPLQILHEFMEARGMKRADLAKLIGSSGTASEIYTGKRRISIGVAKKLAQHFGVSAGLFV